MTENIIVAIITGGLAFCGVLISNRKSASLMEYKIEELTREVRKHNSFAERIPVLEEKMSVANHRIEDLERKVKV